MLASVIFVPEPPVPKLSFNNAPFKVDVCAPDTTPPVASITSHVTTPTDDTTPSITFTTNDTEEKVREKLRVPALNLDQDLYVSGKLATGRVMIKDEDMCVHCGLCAERCPTGAWDIQKNNYIEAHNLNKGRVKAKEVA